MGQSNSKKASPSTSEQPNELLLIADRPPGRLRAAWQVLHGERLVPSQIQGEWIEYQQIFESILQRLSAQLARQARSEKLRLESLIPEEPSHREPSRQDRKAELRRRAAVMRGVPFRVAPKGPEVAVIIENDQGEKQ